MLNTAIDSVEHKANSVLAVLHLKDFRQLPLEFPSPEEAQDMVDALETLSRPGQGSGVRGETGGVWGAVCVKTPF